MPGKGKLGSPAGADKLQRGFTISGGEVAISQARCSLICITSQHIDTTSILLASSFLSATPFSVTTQPIILSACCNEGIGGNVWRATY